MNEQILKIQHIPGFEINRLNNESAVKPAEVKKYSSASFADIFNMAVGLYKETNEIQLDTDQKQIDFVTGKNDDLLSVMIAQEKANTSLQFTVQVTNKVLEAYRELMRMQM